MTPITIAIIPIRNRCSHTKEASNKTNPIANMRYINIARLYATLSAGLNLTDIIKKK